jgi:hypothetical protein
MEIPTVMAARSLGALDSRLIGDSPDHDCFLASSLTSGTILETRVSLTLGGSHRFFTQCILTVTTSFAGMGNQHKPSEQIAASCGLAALDCIS